MTDLGSAAASNMAHMEPEEIATELLALGYMVQIRDGTQPAKDSRSCLRTLKHRFLVCVGWHVSSGGVCAPQAVPCAKQLHQHGLVVCCQLSSLSRTILAYSHQNHFCPAPRTFFACLLIDALTPS